MTRAIRRRRTRSQRGIVLVAALVLAILYFGLMQMMLLDSTRALQEAQRYRSRVIAETLAESGAELAAKWMLSKSGTEASANDPQGTMSGKYVRNGCCDFEIEADGETQHVPTAAAHVRLQGRINGQRVMIDYATHTP